MTTKPVAGKPAPRHPFGPRAIGAILPAITRPALRAAGPAAAQLLADWPVIVGPMLAATTSPRRFAAGTLTLGCAGPVALELQHLSSQLIDRINTHLGRIVVQRLRFLQEAAHRPAPCRLPSRGPAPPVVIIGLPEGPLRDALAALGGAIQREGA